MTVSPKHADATLPGTVVRERQLATSASNSRRLAQERVRKRFPKAQGVVEEFLAERRAEAVREGEGPDTCEERAS